MTRPNFILLGAATLSASLAVSPIFAKAGLRLAPVDQASAVEAATADVQASPSEESAEAASRAIEALRRGDVALAKEIIDRLLIDEQSAAAQQLLGEGKPAEALSAADVALGVDALLPKERAELLVWRGRAAFAVAASDSRQASLYEEALANFEEAARTGAGVGAAFRASRAARMVGDNERALDLARLGKNWVTAKEGRDQGLDLDQSYTRTWAEAAFSSYLAAPFASDEEKAAKAELFTEAAAALEQTIGNAPTDTWAYRELSNLYLWEGRRDDSIGALEAALAVAPADEPTHTALVRGLGDRAEAVARQGGADDAGVLKARFAAIIDRYAAFRETHPENALGYWYGGFESFYHALNEFEMGGADPAGFAAAEALFQGCRARAANYAEPCLDYEILCRVGQGWCLYTAEDNDGAIATFFSAEEIRPAAAAADSGRVAGLDMRLPRDNGSDRLPSALAGLDFVTRRYLSDPADVEALDTAASIGDRMFASRPENANLANNAGFLNRDAAVLWENRAVQLLEGSDEGADSDGAAAARARGQELMEKSWAAYQVAARLLPDDVRVVNDAGLVMAYYLRTDPEAAEAYFLDAIADGEPQLASTTLGEAEREALVEAWGDAHQNMGILEMTIRGQPAKAKVWFEKALEIGPPSRNWLGSVLPFLDQWAETGTVPPEIKAVERTSVWAHNPQRD